jgi:hypothetical protein
MWAGHLEHNMRGMHLAAMCYLLLDCSWWLLWDGQVLASLYLEASSAADAHNDSPLSSRNNRACIVGRAQLFLRCSMLRLLTACCVCVAVVLVDCLVLRVRCRVHLDTGVLTSWQAHTHGLLLPGWRFKAGLRHHVAWQHKGPSTCCMLLCTVDVGCGRLLLRLLHLYHCQYGVSVGRARLDAHACQCCHQCQVMNCYSCIVSQILGCRT